MRRLKYLASSSSFAVLCVVLGSAQASAANAKSSAAGIETVVVTAEKRSQNVQSVPIAITALTSSDLVHRQIVNVTDLSMAVPNMRTDGAGSISIRGVGAYATSTTNAPAVDTNIDGIAGASLGPEVFDLSRIEVLRGPQGTLYGRNTTGGVINMITTPAGRHFGGYLQADVGNYNTTRVEGAVNVPISNGIRERLSGLFLNRDGYVLNVYDNHRIDSRHYYALRSTTEIDISANTHARLLINYAHENDSRTTYGKLVCVPDPITGCSPTQRGFGLPDVLAGNIFHTLYSAFGLLPNPNVNYNLTTYNPPNYRQVNVGYDPQYTAENLLTGLQITHEFRDIEFVSETGYYTSRSKSFAEFDQTAPTTLLTQPVTWFNGLNTITSNQIASTITFPTHSQNFSEEARLVSHFAGPFDFTAGMYYSHYHSSSDFNIYSPVLAIFQKYFLAAYPTADHYQVATPKTDSESIAGYGEFYYKPTPDTKITTGIRYTNDTTSVVTHTTLLSAPPPNIYESESYSALTGKIGIDQKLHFLSADKSMVYADLSRGYKAGGLNPGAPPGYPTSYAPEYVNAFQFGTKNVIDNNFLANIAGFYYQDSGLQLSQSTPFGTVNTNADATIYGLEGEFDYYVSSNFSTNLSLSYLHTRIDKYYSCDTILPAAACVLGPTGLPPSWKGNQLPRSPHFSGNWGIRYARDIGKKWKGILRFNVYYQSSFNVDVFNTPVGQFGGWARADASITFMQLNGGPSLMFYIKNITDAANVQGGGFEGPTVGNWEDAKIIDPRLFGLEVRYNF
jgi:outer membrane receptor protein involved in Fe transport